MQYFLYIKKIGGQPNIHPGLISSTGRGRVGTATSTQAAQLIGGGITPNMFTSPATVSSISFLNPINFFFLKKRNRLIATLGIEKRIIIVVIKSGY